MEAFRCPREFHIGLGSCYAYSPHGEAEASVQSRLVCSRLKRGQDRWLRLYVEELQTQVIGHRRFREYLNRDSTLVPVPPSQPSSPSCCWIAQRLALAMTAAGLASRTWVVLHRVSAVPRSAAAFYWERPTVPEHYASFRVDPRVAEPTSIVLIDDVVTKGRTLLAAAIRLRETFPQARIRAFALMRTMGFVSDIERLIDPCEGEIRWDGTDARRRP